MIIMAENNSSSAISQYFEGDTVQLTAKDDVDDVAKQMTDLKVADKPKDEPEVCRLFAEAPPQVKDPTAVFFDLIGNPSSSQAGGMVSDLELPNAEVS